MKNQTFENCFNLRGCSLIGLVDLKNDLLAVWLVGYIAY